MCLGFEGQSEIQHLPSILKVESDWKLEIQLDGGTLVLSAKSVFDLNVDLSWNMEGSDEHRGEVSLLKPTSADTSGCGLSGGPSGWMQSVSQLSSAAQRARFPASSLDELRNLSTRNPQWGVWVRRSHFICVIKWAAVFNCLKKPELQSNLH